MKSRLVIQYLLCDNLVNLSQMQDHPWVTKNGTQLLIDPERIEVEPVSDAEIEGAVTSINSMLVLVSTFMEIINSLNQLHCIMTTTLVTA